MHGASRHPLVRAGSPAYEDIWTSPSPHAIHTLTLPGPVSISSINSICHKAHLPQQNNTPPALKLSVIRVPFLPIVKLVLVRILIIAPSAKLILIMIFIILVCLTILARTSFTKYHIDPHANTQDHEFPHTEVDTWRLHIRFTEFVRSCIYFLHFLHFLENTVNYSSAMRTFCKFGKRGSMAAAKALNVTR